MGAAASSLDPRHVRIWQNLCAIESTSARISMVETLLAGQEYIATAKRVGLYAGILGWLASQKRGEFYPWPSIGESQPVYVQQQQQQQQSPRQMNPIPIDRPSAVRAPTAPSGPTLRITNTVASQQTALARIPPPKRALDVLHQSYEILGIDETRPLTHETLRAYYKSAALKAHPDKGGSPELFDSVSRAYLYLEEVLNKLIPRTAANGDDPRFRQKVTPESAMRARGINPTAPAPAGTPQIADAPPIALNPKKLDMNVFNKLFEENKLPDPDKDDGYGDWLKTQDSSAIGSKSQTALRGKYNADLFNKMFEEESRRGGAAASSQNQLMQYNQPKELILAPEFGTELGAGRPAQYTKAPAGRAIGYTDLKHAYSEGSTFSQEVSNVDLSGRPKNIEEAKREYGSAPRALTADESAAVSAFELAKKQAEEQRQRRLAAYDVDAESFDQRMKQRLMIRN